MNFLFVGVKVKDFTKFLNNKDFIPRRDSAEQSPKGVQLFLLYILLVWEEVLGVSNFGVVIRLFENPPMFYTPEGLCRAEPERGPIVFTLHFIGVGRGTGGFKFWTGNPPF